MQSISGKKDWKHVFVQKVVTLNTCCDVACLTFQLPHITACFLRPTDDNPQLALFRATNIWRHATNLQSDEKCISQLLWWHFHIYVISKENKVWPVCPHFIFFWDNVNNQKYVICMNNTVENDFFGFPKAKWLHLPGEMDKSARCWCQILSRFSILKIIKIC